MAWGRCGGRAEADTHFGEKSVDGGHFFWGVGGVEGHELSPALLQNFVLLACPIDMFSNFRESVKHGRVDNKVHTQCAKIAARNTVSITLA